ncbi:hypothetical protein HWV62_15843 [Athelia sp. TMB]|nr:hypothetical protein HWV62_15843 [Athelia sp. TMB]
MYNSLALVFAGSGTNMLVLSSRNAPADGFVYQGPPSADSSISLRIALAQADTKGLENALYEVSTPSSSKFGKHLSKAEVEKYVTPTSETQTTIMSFLSSYGVTATNLSSAGDWLGFKVPVGTANEMFAANFSVFKQESSSMTLIRTLSYSIPTSLKTHVEGIHPTTSFTIGHGSAGAGALASLSPSAQLHPVPGSCNTTVTPACIQAMYGLPTALATQSTNGIAVAGTISQWPQFADLKMFLTEERPDLNPNTTFTVDLIANGTDPQSPGTNAYEANLDTQYTVGLASGVPVTFVSAGQLDSPDIAGIFLDIAHYLTAMEHPPQVLSSSYGFNESFEDFPTLNKLCNAYMQLGARGVSVVFGSGDGGVAGIYNQTCTDSSLIGMHSLSVTSVGGTTGWPETAASLSSGGFSNYFEPAAYTKPFIASYLKKLGSTNAGRYNVSGRAFPDVAAQALFVKTFNEEKVQLINGTSCSTPIFASTLALINDQLIAKGKSVLGFINPLLYAHPEALNDITTGSNPGCGTDGFPAASGWDPVTGLGTPNFDKLKAILGL